ncbi:hypothetical protein DYB28_004678 [Aphanomyces astaci]|uniref:Uncharacterized protein n=1 Tax=Aphanomyces astaci TaxID=112090 RepID=A0A9X8DVY0_APHAT|nr:hypothetical protein DYB28_004678 [Aphanomyces astaci]
MVIGRPREVASGLKHTTKRVLRRQMTAISWEWLTPEPIKPSPPPTTKATPPVAAAANEQPNQDTNTSPARGDKSPGPHRSSILFSHALGVVAGQLKMGTHAQRDLVPEELELYWTQLQACSSMLLPLPSSMPTMQVFGPWVESLVPLVTAKCRQAIEALGAATGDVLTYDGVVYLVDEVQDNG